MPVTQAAINRYIEAYGPYLFHDTKAYRRIHAMLAEGIVPASEQTKAPRGFGGSRPGFVYLGTQKHISQWVDGNCHPPLRVDIRELDPKNFAADEDFLHGIYWRHFSSGHGFLKAMIKELPEVCQANGPRKVQWNPQGIFETVRQCGGRSGWAQKHGDFLDKRRAAQYSLGQGSIAYRGIIIPELLSMNPEWIDSHKKNTRLIQSLVDVAPHAICDSIIKLYTK